MGRILAGRYRLGRLVGHGGMGSVYEAHHVHMDKRVAIKILSGSLSKDLKLVARFRREAVAASRLEHENCVHVDDFGEDADGTFFISMEFIEGHGLADELRKTGPMPPDRVARIAVQLLKALDAAHAAGVLHRDLKPQNVMLTNKPGRVDLVKVVDFGIAKITTNTPEDQGALTVPGTIFGTPEYMSPEQARGETLDARSDLYSASVVLWHMLLGRSPFRGSSVRETLMKVFADEPPSPAQERPNLKMPAGFEGVLKKGMAKKKEDRYPDAAAFLEALRPYVTGTAVEIPRRAQPGSPTDGSPPPITLDDQRSATLPLPANELAPIQTAHNAPAVALGGNPPTPSPATGHDATQFGALPTLPMTTVNPVLPDQKPPKVVGVDPVVKQPLVDKAAAPQPPPQRPAPEQSVYRRRRRLSNAAIVVIAVAVAGLVIMVVAAILFARAYQSGAFKDEKKVVDLSKRETVTSQEHAKQKEQLEQAFSSVQVDPAARDAALARADEAFASRNLDNARAAYGEALIADPTSPKALQGLALVAMQQKDWRTAMNAFEKLMTLDEKYRHQFAPMHARAKKLAEEKD